MAVVVEVVGVAMVVVVVVMGGETVGVVAAWVTVVEAMGAAEVAAMGDEKDMSKFCLFWF